MGSEAETSRGKICTGPKKVGSCARTPEREDNMAVYELQLRRRRGTRLRQRLPNLAHSPFFSLKEAVLVQVLEPNTA